MTGLCVFKRRIEFEAGTSQPWPLRKLKLSAPAPTRPSWLRVALVIAALVGFYLLGKQGQIAQWGALLVGSGCRRGGVRHLRAGQGIRGLCTRLPGAKSRKVVWPTRKEAIQMTAYVFAFVAVMAFSCG
jgi:hypothetical protein